MTVSQQHDVSGADFDQPHQQDAGAVRHIADAARDGPQVEHPLGPRHRSLFRPLDSGEHVPPRRLLEFDHDGPESPGHVRSRALEPERSRDHGTERVTPATTGRATPISAPCPASPRPTSTRRSTSSTARSTATTCLRAARPTSRPWPTPMPSSTARTARPGSRRSRPNASRPMSGDGLGRLTLGVSTGHREPRRRWRPALRLQALDGELEQQCRATITQPTGTPPSEPRGAVQQRSRQPAIP